VSTLFQCVLHNSLCVCGVTPPPLPLFSFLLLEYITVIEVEVWGRVA
jgi:hypothetical protein